MRETAGTFLSAITRAPVIAVYAVALILREALRFSLAVAGLALWSLWVAAALIACSLHAVLQRRGRFGKTASPGAADRWPSRWWIVETRSLGRDLAAMGLRSLRRSSALALAGGARAAGGIRAAARALAQRRRRGQMARLDFESDYCILERLPPGGSTARIFIVQQCVAGVPRGEKLVLKHFDLAGGSHLEHVVRESGAVRLAERLGIVRDARMSKRSFYYVLPFRDGETLTRKVLTLHRSLRPGQRLGEEDVARMLRWQRDLLAVIAEYHAHGVFHKDIKPDNLIADGDRLHLIDIGLLTPFESTLQLTTHGTEYFRDPEMVKLALRGAAVRDVDCAKFDVYSAGAVLFFMLEGEFPACGSLSRPGRTPSLCLQWIASRAMTDFEKRYATAKEMLRDVEALLARAEAGRLEEATVADLPSFTPEPTAKTTVEAGGGTAVAKEPPQAAEPAAPHNKATPGPFSPAAPAATKSQQKRRGLIATVAALAGAALIGGVIAVHSIAVLNAGTRDAWGSALLEIGKNSRSALRWDFDVGFPFPTRTRNTAPCPDRGYLLRDDGRLEVLDLGGTARQPAFAAGISPDRQRALETARLAGAFRSTLRARTGSRQASALVISLPSADGQVLENASLRAIKLALAAEGVPFVTDVDEMRLSRASVEIERGLQLLLENTREPAEEGFWPAALGAGGAIERSLQSALPEDAASAFLLCIQCVAPRSPGDDPRFRVLLGHARAVWVGEPAAH